MTSPKAAVTLPQLLRASAAAYGDAVAVRAEGTDGMEEAISFAELERQSAQLARGLLARGVGKGSRVGFILGNGPGFAVMLAATARIGAVAIPISTLIKAGELVRVLRQSDIGGLILQREFMGYDYAARVAEALPALSADGKSIQLAEVPYLRWIVSAGAGLPGGIRDLSWLTDAADEVSEEILLSVESEVHPSDQMVEIYTSGSMALPKGVRHNHGPVLFRTGYLRGMLGIEKGKDVIAQLPMFWIGGLMMYLMPGLQAGATVVCPGRTLSNSRYAMGSVLTEEDLAALSKQPKPWWGLGMSETLGPYSYADEFRAPGRPLCAPMDHFADGYDIRIADENNQPVPDGGIGEMQVRGYPVTPGLHKIERSVHFTPDGYYRTGDMCEVEGSRVHFVGRDGDMIKTAGSNVSPAEVEMELQALDTVEAAYVFGLPDKERGQLVVAAVIAADGCDPDFAEIEAAMRQRLSGYKVPRAWVWITREEVPILHSNKVARRELVKLVAQRLGRATA
ncbi:class I adenylate-forming enzyme family protein [Novosphingobium sp. TH158]|uniref:class I adenylate-forming enzyme family protein n=1 Tax=Novosphingobium sp. TH158 TaxID=2067455 RepID=UPI001181955E|nr:class I adenylate-forming enzyme family protein [Novosphingobium sp. TH158]